MKTEHFWQIFFILIGALASAYAGYWLGNQAEDISIIEYRKDVDGNLQELFGGAKKLEIKYGGKELKEISRVSYVIANTSKKNLGKVKLYFEVQDMEKLPVFHNVSPSDNYPKDAITLISDDNGVYVFELEYMNRVDNIWRQLQFSFYFAGVNPPDVTVKAGTKGVSVQEYEYKVDVVEMLSSLIRITWWLIAIYLVLIYLHFKFNKAYQLRKELDFKEYLYVVLNNSSGISVEEKIAGILEKNKSSPSVKNTISMMFDKEPKRSD